MRIASALVLAAMLASATAARANSEDLNNRSRGAQLAWDNGFRTCNPLLDAWIKFVHENDDDYGYSGLWSENHADNSDFSLTTSESFENSVKITVFNVSRNIMGNCDASYFSSWTVDSSCSEIRENQVKDWDFVGEISGTSVYSEPKIKNHEIYLSPLPKARCSIGKKIATFNVKPDALSK